MRVSFLLLITFILLVSCDNTETIIEKQEPVIPPRPGVYDSNKEYIGELKSQVDDTYTILNDLGYLFTIYSNGTPVYYTMVFSEPLWRGTAHAQWDVTSIYYKTVYISHTTADALYVVDYDEDNNPIIEHDIVFASWARDRGEPAGGTIVSGILLKNASWGDIGVRNDYGNIEIIE